MNPPASIADQLNPPTTSAGVNAVFQKVTDMTAIMAFDLLSTPGLVINDKLVSSGRIPTQAEVKQWLRPQ